MARAATLPPEGLPGADLVPARYRVEALLGRGGMASVYRVTDVANDRELALKQLSLDRRAANRNAVIGLFEREFHTLTHLQHPHVIAVHDYGLLADGNPYYTMELLDGDDLRDRAPVPWREACRLLFDVCSSLALLHSRRFLHRDISPRNIRCTTDGRAKLIDFGAMAPMTSGGADVVGTPAFIAPETLHRLALDARTDLFSFGATLYYALTAHVPYPASSFAEVIVAWNGAVAAPSSWLSGIPAALDDLVLALISVEPALRPRSAFEVMQRLAALAGLQTLESQAVSRAYLATPTLVGRDDALKDLRTRLLASRVSRGGSLCLEGPGGVGRSRLLDACALEAMPLGFTVLRATASSARDSFATVRALTTQLMQTLAQTELDAAPSELFEPPTTAAKRTLRSFSDGGASSEQLQLAINQLWLSVSRKHRLMLAIDDVHRIDASSAAVLAALLDRSRRAGIFVLLGSNSDEARTEASNALIRRCDTLRVDVLSRDDTCELLGSLFGEATHLDMLADELHALTQGNPRQIMDLAQHLIDQDIIRYDAGTWTLPSRLSNAALPHSADTAKRARIERLGPNARFLAQCQALAFYENLRSLDHHALLPDASVADIEGALSELLSAGIVSSDGATYALPNRLWTTALTQAIPAHEIVAHHNALARMYKPHSNVAFIYHAFAGDLDEAGLEALLELNAGYANSIDTEQVVEQNVAKMMVCYPRAHRAAEHLGKSPRVRNDLRRWNLVGTSTLEFVSYPESAEAWLAQLEHDCGLDLYRADADTSDAGQRLMRALTTAQQRYAATPESERVYSLEEAIRLLAEYVVFCIVIAVRSQNYALLRPLPALLEPFAVLSPVLDAIWQNAIATCETSVDAAFESARARWTAALSKLDAMTDSDVKHAKEIAAAIAFGIGCVEAQLGLPSAASWAERLNRNIYQRLSGLQLLRIERLEQGDWKSAERYRRQAEVLSLRSRAPQMFSTLLTVELNVCTRAGELSGVRDALERIRTLAAHYPGWVSTLRYAEGCFHAVRGDHEAAIAKYTECITQTAFTADGASTNATMWFAAHQGLAGAWLELGDAHKTRAVVERALSRLPQRSDGGVAAHELTRLLALAEAKLGEPTAAARLEAAIAEQQRAGVTGLQLGVSYEARAQIAIWRRDALAFERYADLTAREYRYGADSALGVRYNRLRSEAGRHGLHARALRLDAATTTTSTHESSQLWNDDPRTLVQRMLAGTRNTQEVAQIALELICAARQADGHLYTFQSGELVLTASRGAVAATPDLSAMRELITAWEAHEEAMDDIATGLLDEELFNKQTTSLDTLAKRSGFELLLLTGLSDGIATLAGVAAITGASPCDAVRQSQLLQALATKLLEANVEA